TTADALADFGARYAVAYPQKYVTLYRLRDALTTQLCVLGAMIDFADTVGTSRGSSLYTDAKGQLPRGLEEIFRFAYSGARPAADRIQSVRLAGGECSTSWRAVRPLPEGGDVFELVWQGYRENGNVY
ncbi:MAG: oxidoreductase, partial [Clostridia bacterium]|nr:oxidoreductase [Clostridia bacterium]